VVSAVFVSSAFLFVVPVSLGALVVLPVVNFLVEVFLAVVATVLSIFAVTGLPLFLVTALPFLSIFWAYVLPFLSFLYMAMSFNLLVNCGVWRLWGLASGTDLRRLF